MYDLIINKRNVDKHLKSGATTAIIILKVIQAIQVIQILLQTIQVIQILLQTIQVIQATKVIII